MTNTSRRTADQATTLRGLNSQANAVTFKPPESPITKVYSITSGKGGVGKTAVVSNLA